jgi:hypothetical protein
VGSRAAARNKKSNRGLDRLLPLFFSSPAVNITVTCKTHKNATTQSILSLDLFRSASLSFFLG